MAFLNDKRGLTFFYTLMLGITIIVLGMALAYPIKQIIDNSRTDLNCAAPSTDWDEAVCYGLDISKPFITGFFILLGVFVIGAKHVFGG